MRSILFVVTAMMFACAAPTWAGDDLTICVSTRFVPKTESALTVAAAEKELQNIWRYSGVAIHVRCDAVLSSAADMDVTAMVNQHLWVTASSDFLLGYARVPPPSPGNASVFVSALAISRLLDLRPAEQRLAATKSAIYAYEELGRALGRVIAHEIGHVLLGPGHEPVGLMRRQFTPIDLGSVEPSAFQLTDRDRADLHYRATALRSAHW
jgi:hypothetical protein